MAKLEFEKKYVFSGYGFGTEGPYLKLDELESTPPHRHHLNIMNETFTLSRFKGRRCIGQYDLGTFDEVPCPGKNVLEKTSPHCPSCLQTIGFNPAFYNTPLSLLSKQQTRYNEEVHNVYLVYFGPGEVKVGIANVRRTLNRWLEQGARSALVIQECRNAYEARSLESQISTKLQIKETITTKKKRELFNNHFNLDLAHNELEGVRNKIQINLGIKLKQNPMTDLDEYYLGGNKLSNECQDVSNQTPLFISGRAIGLIGDTIVFEQDNNQLIASLKALISHVVNLSRTPKAYPNTEKQIKLF